ncbi:hypothetical protein EVAR_18194_1 [Eumeta japonica]|uniref:Uncharacterized protein n=1 Tax=Eumeta variegata TaxID=151549 RepID=A0A4C1UVD1_EUMVA|nr:hypothetical protein EVAR_18194_1 [Eumeta japonica]
MPEQWSFARRLSGLSWEYGRFAREKRYGQRVTYGELKTHESAVCAGCAAVFNLSKEKKYPPAPRTPAARRLKNGARRDSFLSRNVTFFFCALSLRRYRKRLYRMIEELFESTAGADLRTRTQVDATPNYPSTAAEDRDAAVVTQKGLNKTEGQLIRSHESSEGTVESFNQLPAGPAIYCLIALTRSAVVRRGDPGLNSKLSPTIPLDACTNGARRRSTKDSSAFELAPEEPQTYLVTVSSHTICSLIQRSEYPYILVAADGHKNNISGVKRLAECQARGSKPMHVK